MKCEKAIQEFLKQEDSLNVSLSVRLHLLFCARCREEIRNLMNVFLKAADFHGHPAPEDSADIIMSRIIESGLIHERNVSFSKWLFTGGVIFFSIFLISYSDSFIWLRNFFGRELEIPLNLVLGVVITVYAGSFIASHIDEVKKIIDNINHKIHQ